MVGEILRAMATPCWRRTTAIRRSSSAVHEGVIHLVVTDLVMPHMGGRELIDRMMPRRPDVRVLFVSGYADDTITDYDALGAGFLEKPFAAPDLVRKVREVLSTPRKGTPATG